MNISRILNTKHEKKTESHSFRLTKKNMEFLDELTNIHGNSKNDALNILIEYCREEYKKEEGE